jgi:hypothetical protein
MTDPIHDAGVQAYLASTPQPAATVIQAVVNAIARHDNHAYHAERLRMAYEYGSPMQRQTMDYTVRCLCGWSLGTLLAGTPPRTDDVAPRSTP